MNQEEIKRLLEKYYNGESTEAEETLLKEFFSREDIPDDLAEEREIFRYFSGPEGIPEPSPEFESRIISALDSVDRESFKLRQRRMYGILTGIAAGIAILAGSYYFFLHKPGPRDTYSDPQIAYTETMKILYNVSVQLNNGTSALKPVGKLNKSKGILVEKMRKLDKFNRTVQVLDMIDNKKQNNN
ncbi:MAG: hypothetical protein Q8868_04860 [Bacteroidota bacterium]|nr:hypothetical protein [Bacteroidota bacterium]